MTTRVSNTKQSNTKQSSSKPKKAKQIETKLNQSKSTQTQCKKRSESQKYTSIIVLQRRQGAERNLSTPPPSSQSSLSRFSVVVSVDRIYKYIHREGESDLYAFYVFTCVCICARAIRAPHICAHVIFIHMCVFNSCV